MHASQVRTLQYGFYLDQYEPHFIAGSQVSVAPNLFAVQEYKCAIVRDWGKLYQTLWVS